MEYFIGWLVFVIVTSVATFSESETQVILMPDHDGHVGQVEVVTDAGAQLLTEAGQMTVVKSRSNLPSDVVVLEQKEIESVFSDALDAEPVSPQKFILYFMPDSTNLTTESTALIPEILRSIKARDSSYVSIFGHSDRVGSQEYNFILSTNRAITVRDILVNRNVSIEKMETASHGEGNPLVETPDGVAEPRNRRVEIVVR